MNIRLFSKKHNLYTNSPLWPSNQRSFSDWALSPSGEVIEIVSFDDERSSSYITKHDPRTFDIEPWSGYFDSTGKKIYRGDIVRLLCFNLDYEVVWNFERFSLRVLYESHCGEIYPWFHSNDCEKNYGVVGNIHGVDYAD